MNSISNSIMGDIVTGKVISRSFPHISHLPGSKMIDDEDKLIGEEDAGYVTCKTRLKDDMVIVTEKIDGMNACIYRKDDHLYPLMRRGYDCRTSGISWIRAFSRYVEDNATRFMSILENNERICGEWMVKQHTLSYNLPGEPFVPFDIIYGTGKNQIHCPYFKFRKIVSSIDLVPTGLVHAGVAIKPEDAMKLLGKGFAGVNGDPEGVVYRYENKDGIFILFSKFVANQTLGNDELFKAEDDGSFNGLKSRYKKYTEELE